MEEHHHDDRTAECQLPPSRGTSRPRAAPRLHQLHHVPCQDQEREGGHADSRAAAFTAALPGDDGTPDPNPVHHPSSGRVNQPRAAEQLAPPSAAACTAGRKTDGPLHGAAAPGGGGRPEADPAARLPHHSGFNAIHPVTRPATHFWDEKPSLAAAAPAAVPPRSDPAPSPEAGKGEAHSGRVERGHHMGQSNGRPPARDPYTDPRKQLEELLKARLSNEEFTRQLAQLRCELLNQCEYEAESDGTGQTQPTESGSATPPTATRLAEALADFICCRWRAAARRALGLGTDSVAGRQPDAPPPAALRLAVPLCAAHGGRSADSSLASPPPVADDAAEGEASTRKRSKRRRGPRPARHSRNATASQTGIDTATDVQQGQAAASSLASPPSVADDAAEGKAAACALDAVGAEADIVSQDFAPSCSARTGRSPLPSDSLRDSAADSSLASPPAVADDAAEDGPLGSHGIEEEEFALHCIDEHAATAFALHCVDGSLAELRRRLAEVARRYGREGVLALLEHGADVAHPERYAIPQVLRADGNRVAVTFEPVCTVLLRSGADVLHVSRAPLLDRRLSRKYVRWAKPFVRWTWDVTWSFEF